MPRTFEFSLKIFTHSTLFDINKLFSKKLNFTNSMNIKILNKMFQILKIMPLFLFLLTNNMLF